LSPPPSICVVLAGETLEEDLRLLESCRTRIDLAELRVDHLLPQEAAAAGRFPARARVPVILTVRRSKDGGRFSESEAHRIALLRRLAGAGFAYVDLEDDLRVRGLDEQVRAAGAKVVRSIHDLDGVPSGLAGRLDAMARSAAEIPLAIVSPSTSRDLAEVLGAFAKPGGLPRVVLAKGDMGFPTRVLAGRLGSAWCYASATDPGAAPGHVSPAVLEEVYRFRAVTPDTALYGVIGNPVMHSRSPMIHNRGFTVAGIDAVYVPFHVPDIDGFWAVADALGIRGLSVTVPHKSAVLGPRVRGDGDVIRIGSCNTLVRPSGSGSWAGSNTDVEGFLAPLRAAFGGAVPEGLRATVIGAGGAARSVVAALSRAGARVLILNRTVEKAQTLASAFQAAAGALDSAGIDAARGFADLIVQTTSAGMTPKEEEDPAPAFPFTGRELVYELVYAPPKTRFVRRALQAGCRVCYGRQMLLAQAALQFQCFTGVEYPPRLMRELEETP
jgi:3-dehydroquinate dehydratase / shikimate dehydrogenase